MEGCADCLRIVSFFYFSSVQIKTRLVGCCAKDTERSDDTVKKTKLEKILQKLKRWSQFFLKLFCFFSISYNFLQELIEL